MVFSPDAAPPANDAADADGAPHGGPASDPEVEPVAGAESPSVAQPDQENDGLIGGSLLADLESRAHSNQPAPHPVRPQELWHPDVTQEPVEIPPPPAEERIGQAELEGAENAPARFRFNRLKRVSPGETPAEPNVAPGADASTADAGGEGPVDDVLFGELFTSDRVPSSTEGLGSGAAPLVPTSGGITGGLINGPVRRNPRSSGRALRPLPERDLPPLARSDESDVAPVAVSAPAATSHDVVTDPSDEHEAAPPVDAPVDPTAATALEAEPLPFVVDADGVVDVDDGVIRLAPDADAAVTDDGSTLSVALTEGWCWVALDGDARTLTVAAGGIALQCPPVTTVLVTVDSTGRFVVVVRGEAILLAGDRRIRLRTGAMAFLPHGTDEAQVDVATDAEIASDDLVARNLELDANR